MPIDENAAFCGTCGHRLVLEDGPVPPAADPLIGMVVDGRYKIIDLIGSGGMGAVYRVEHVKMGKIMAMKLLHGELSSDSDVVKRFRREAQAVSKLSHVNNVSVFDFGSYEGLMYLVMEYIDGVDLSEHLRRDGAMAVTRVLEIIIQVCSGLIDAHSKGIVHRDLKPENIIVSSSLDPDEEDFVKVVDFGLAQLREGPGRTKITQQGSLVGTPYYMAPEHIRGDQVDARSDIYALGAVMYKLLTAQAPFMAPTPMGIITKHLTEEVEAPSVGFPDLGIPPQVDEVVLKAMSKDPDHRYQSAEELRRVLAELLSNLKPGSKAERYTAGRGESAWQLGDLPHGADQASNWAMGDQNRTPIMTNFPAEAGVLQTAADEARAAVRPSTITIGAREMAIGTREDVTRFEKRIKARRVVTIVVLVTLLLGAMGAGVYLFHRYGVDDSIPTLETEPNASPGQADTLTSGVQLTGTISSGGQTADIDWYKLTGPRQGDWAVEVEITGVPSADLALQLVGPGSTDAIAASNFSGPGGGEKIYPVVVGEPTVYVMVQEVRRPGVPPGNFPQPYGIVYRMFDPSTVEREPNDSLSSATPAYPGTPIQGRLAKEGDVDWYCLPSGLQARLVKVSGIEGIDISLGLVFGSDAREVAVNSAPIGGAEMASLEGGVGPICVAVRSSRVAELPYNIIFQ